MHEYGPTISCYVAFDYIYNLLPRRRTFGIYFTISHEPKKHEFLGHGYVITTQHKYGMELFIYAVNYSNLVEDDRYQYHMILCHICLFSTTKTISLHYAMAIKQAYVDAYTKRYETPVLMQFSCNHRIILGMGPATQRMRYIVTPHLIGWAPTENDPRETWICIHIHFRNVIVVEYWDVLWW